MKKNIRRRFLGGAIALCLVSVTIPEAPGFNVTFEDVNPDSSTLDVTDADGASGGRVNGLASVAGDNQVFYAASEWGGLYKSTDGGLTWFHLGGHLPVATWDVEVDPSNTDTVYATSLSDGRATPVSGIQVSYDAGVTWTHPATAHPDPALEGTPADNTPPGFVCAAARRAAPSAFGIAIQPGAPQNVFVGTNCGVAISNDSGATWRFVDPTPGDAADDIWDVLVQAGGIVDVCGDDGHLRSPDGGTTWNFGAGLPAGRCSLAASPDESYVLFAAAADNNLYETDDAGGTWTNLGTPDSRRQGRVPFVVTNQRTGAAFDLWYGDVRLFRGGCTTPAAPAPGGANRCPAANAVPGPPPAGWAGPFTRSAGGHDDVGDLVFDTTVSPDACPIVFSSDGGVYRNTNLAAGCDSPSWEQPNVTPHALWIYGMDGADQGGASNEDLYFGCQDDGTFAATDAGAVTPTWFNRDCCDGFDIVADPNRVISTLCCGFSLRLSNPGMVGTVGINGPPGADPSFRFPDYVDQYGDNRYVSVSNQGAYITTDITASPVVWTQLGAATTPAGGFCAVQAAVSGGTPTFYAQTFCIPGNSGIVETPGSGQVWRFDGTDPTGAWQRVDNNDGLTGGFAVVAVAPGDPQRLYASHLAAGGPQMVFSADGGQTWDRDLELENLMSGGGAFLNPTNRGATPQPRFNGYAQPSLLAYDENDPDVIVAGGRDSGIFLSVTGGDRWVLLSDPLTSHTSGVPHLPRPWFAYFDREPTDPPGRHSFFVGTQGRGVWRVSVDNQPPVCDADGPYVEECAGATTPVTLDGSGSSDPDGDALEFEWTGPFVGGVATGVMPTVSFAGTGVFTVDLEVSDPLESDTCSAQVSIVDTLPPEVSCSVATSTLWPPNHELIDVGLEVSAIDVCAGELPVTVEVFSDEDDDEPTGSGNHSPDAKTDPLRLRSERKGNGDGRVYLIRASSTDPAGNTGYDCCTVTVTKSQSQQARAAVAAQAAAAEATCDPGGAIPPGFVVVGDGPTVGPKQSRSRPSASGRDSRR